MARRMATLPRDCRTATCTTAWRSRPTRAASTRDGWPQAARYPDGPSVPRDRRPRTRGRATRRSSTRCARCSRASTPRACASSRCRRCSTRARCARSCRRLVGRDDARAAGHAVHRAARRRRMAQAVSPCATLAARHRARRQRPARPSAAARARVHGRRRRQAGARAGRAPEGGLPQPRPRRAADRQATRRLPAERQRCHRGGLRAAALPVAVARGVDRRQRGARLRACSATSTARSCASPSPTRRATARGRTAAPPAIRSDAARSSARARASPRTATSRTRAMFPELNDGDPPGAVLWRARFADQGRSGTIPKGSSGDCSIPGRARRPHARRHRPHRDQRVAQATAPPRARLRCAPSTTATTAAIRCAAAPTSRCRPTIVRMSSPGPHAERIADDSPRPTSRSFSPPPAAISPAAGSASSCCRPSSISSSRAAKAATCGTSPAASTSTITWARVRRCSATRIRRSPQAVAAQLRKGTTYYFLNEPEIELARQARRGHPVRRRRALRRARAPRRRSTALRMARAFTGRNKIMKFEGAWHGMHDYGLWGTVPSTPSPYPRALPDSVGVPPQAGETVLVAPFNDTERAVALIEAHAHELAAVIVEPLQRVLLPEPGFLRGGARRSRRATASCSSSTRSSPAFASRGAARRRSTAWCPTSRATARR